jgi:ABC-2 type transport system ATP-binding protein
MSALADCPAPTAVVDAAPSTPATARAAAPDDASAPGRPVAVQLDELTKAFPARRTWQELARAPFRRDRTRVLDRVTFTVHVGEFFGLLGLNGAGKTTLFRTLATSVLPDSGTATVFGHDVDVDADRVRGTVSCVMANDRSVYWRLSATENLRLFAALYGLHGAPARRRIDEVLALVGLADTGTKMVGLFSSGMRQRLLIARALLPRPRLLLLDEPTRSLDPVAARDFRRFLRTEVATANECTVLLATHSSEEAMELCDRVAVLDRGRVLAVGPAEQLKRRFGDSAFMVWTRSPVHTAFAALAARGVEVAPDRTPDADGWYRVRLAIPGTLDEACGVLTALRDAGVDVARFERVDLELAELLRRIVARGQEG